MPNPHPNPQTLTHADVRGVKRGGGAGGPSVAGDREGAPRNGRITGGKRGGGG